MVGNRQDPIERDPASRKRPSRKTDDRNGEERPARESAHTADWKLMRMRERTRSNCGRRYPSTSVAKVEGGETTQGLGTTRHWWRLWLLAHGYSVVCTNVPEWRRLLSSPRFGTPLADLPLFKIGKLVERGCPFRWYRYRWRSAVLLTTTLHQLDASLVSRVYFLFLIDNFFFLIIYDWLNYVGIN